MSSDNTQRVATEDNEALRSGLVKRLHASRCTVAGCLATSEAEQDVDTVLSALAAEGYTVVKTEPDDWVYGYTVDWQREVVRVGFGDPRHWNEGEDRERAHAVRRRVVGPWEPVPEAAPTTPMVSLVRLITAASPGVPPCQRCGECVNGPHFCKGSANERGDLNG